MRAHSGRREFLRTIAGVGVAAFPFWASGSTRRATYDPSAKFDVQVSELTFRRNEAGRALMARVYQPQGAGPFPVLLDLHGGGWNYKDRYANEPMDRAIATSGVLVAAIDMTLAGEAPYPASVQDAHYGVRWLKWKAPEWNGVPTSLGVLGSSTGGHVGELLAMRPRHARYAAHQLPEALHLDASILYFASRSPISDPYARYQQAEKMKREQMIKYSKTWFVPWETARSGNLLRDQAVESPNPAVRGKCCIGARVRLRPQSLFQATARSAPCG